MIALRDCPMCHKPPSDDGVILTSETVIDLEIEEAIYEIGYTVRCCNCGASVSHEYRDEVIALWNGETTTGDEEAEG